MSGLGVAVREAFAEISNAPKAAGALFDKVVKSGHGKSKVKNPYAYAWGAVKGAYKKKGNRWVKKKVKKQHESASESAYRLAGLQYLEANSQSSLGQLNRTTMQAERIVKKQEERTSKLMRQREDRVKQRQRRQRQRQRQW